jgi:hypothetical protein
MHCLSPKKSAMCDRATASSDVEQSSVSRCRAEEIAPTANHLPADDFHELPPMCRNSCSAAQAFRVHS